MPYIKPIGVRIVLNAISDSLIFVLTKYGLRGNLNYFLYRTIKHLKSDMHYADYADYLSELHEAEMEIRRRLMIEYENKKIIENGDVD